MEMQKEYSIEMEKEVQKKWENNKIYKFMNDEKRPPYIIDTPPPYPTGRMHLGHGLNWTYMDIIARFKRMNGYDVLFPQGWDCHGLPTEVKVEEINNITKSDIDRHEFRRLCVELTEENIEKMRNQVKSLGISIDWDREYITMTPEYVKKSQTAFVRMYKDGLIYRGKHPVNWCPRCQTAIAFAEVEYKERTSKLNYIKFPYMENEEKYLTIATSRPELMAACVGIVVHPEDERYKDVIGKKVKVPLFNQEVTVYPDEDVEKEFGTGVVMVCTFGDKTDVVWVNRHGLEIKKAIDEKGELTEICGKYSGMKSEEARGKIIEDLKCEGYLIKQEPLEQNVGVCWRCKTPIEIIVGDQWFVNVKKLLPESEKVTNELNWVPEHMKTRLLNWIKDMDWDWCISRQRLFATPIPVWYCPKCGEVIVAKEEDLPLDPTKESPYTCKCGNSDLIPETDVLDTWMDSSITPMVIAGWLEDEEFFKKHYPVQLRPQGHDIIRTWAFYTIIKSIALTGEKPWDEIVINGMVFGEDGHKMSKSRGNVVEPGEITKEYGADALRLWAANSTIGNDVPFAWKEVDYGYRFLRKFWNAARFAKMNIDDEVIEKLKTMEDASANIENPVDLWILSKLNRLIKRVTEDLENYRFNTVVEIQKFVWHEFCDNYIEMVKHRLYNKESTEEAQKDKLMAQYTLYKVITDSLRLITPFTPHFADIVGEIYKMDNIHTSWCRVDESLINEENEYIGEVAKNTVSSLRRFKSNKGMPLNSELSKVEIYVSDEKDYNALLKAKCDVKGALKIKELEIIHGKPALEQKIVEVVPNKSKIGPEFKKDAGKVMNFIKNADEETIEKILSEGLKVEDEFEAFLTKEHIKDVKRAIFNEGEVVETTSIDGLVDTLAIIH
ncbi:MAG: valyl-tRNA synthetase [Methanothermococcus sp.]|jgi:valyl-tRNA synthetase|uniref:valine--tRNA ligase n=1 Tax=Methanothermococcus TaxID=155862 RepID=UPI00035C9B2F|nr:MULTISPECIES: valine--tRNA ligase [Methanothermococcus]MDK2791027.1 valyl-tRNA synthetase [Methanothermococcus sp.]MDK2987899.1 valyl-tRNA synthetase [Methanothermococcus sp.]